jgi:predicted RNA-binding protein with RPS1 domain
MNKKKLIGHITDIVPDFVKNLADYYKTDLDVKAKELVENSSGSLGLVIKLIAKPITDTYFEKKKESILSDYGSTTYLKAGIKQAIDSFEATCSDLNINSSDIKLIIGSLGLALTDSVSQLKARKDLLMVFQAKYHPMVVLVKNSFEDLITKIKLDNDRKKNFILHYNDNVAKAVAMEFGTFYEEHLKEVNQKVLADNEADLLWDTVELGKIGFKEDENLRYEETYGIWAKVSELNGTQPEEGLAEKGSKGMEEANIGLEGKLKPVTKLVEQYFNKESPDNHLDKILFIVADFGKGKSVFLKRYASELAKRYFETKEGYIPIYFNLRSFKKYEREHKFGVIAEFLEAKYGIKLEDEHFKGNNYIFLIDSLDESGELNKRRIDYVVNSVKKIQGIDRTHCTRNKIVITTRPFDDGLVEQLSLQHMPYTLLNVEDRPVEYFISLYGFKKEQFNEWIISTLKSNKKFNQVNLSGYLDPIIESIRNGKNEDVYASLLKNETLSSSELRRPIFAYMVAELILNNIDFSDVGKIGVYLSFLNLLTKEAKYINDPGHKVDLVEHYEARNILHTVAALWNYKRRFGGQGFLKKADICRAIEGIDNRESDDIIVERFKGKGVNEIQFLSHSYFGENDNLIHFQHQSFAEILLAEYYLKVFIKHALDPDSKVEEARLRLIIGDPTSQTVSFFEELLKLLKETISNGENAEKKVIEKRQLVAPLLASLATTKFNRHLSSSYINYTWFTKVKGAIETNTTKLPEELLQQWPINSECIEKIVALCKEIMGSKPNYSSLKGDNRPSLFDNETFVTQVKFSQITPDIDKWLALLVGNRLFNSIDKKQFFNEKFDDYQTHQGMIKNWCYYSNVPSPIWGRTLFMGMNFQANKDYIDFSRCNLAQLDFSYSYLKYISFDEAKLTSCKFHSTTLENVDFSWADLRNSSFKNITIVNFGVQLALSTIEQGVFMPYKLCDLYFRQAHYYKGPNRAKSYGIFTNFGYDYSMISSQSTDVEELYETVSEFMIYAVLQGKAKIPTLSKWFYFVNKHDQNRFYTLLKEEITTRQRSKARSIKNAKVQPKLSLPISQLKQSRIPE